MVPGMMGVMFRQLGWMECIMMIISTVCALSLTPMLCSQLLKLNPKKGIIFTKLFTPIEKALDKLDDGYAALLNWVVRHRAITILICLAMFISSFGLMKFVGSEFIPTS